MIQQFHSWLFLQRKQKRSFEKRDTLQCLLKHCLQQPRHGSNLNVHQQTQTDGADVVFICNGILLSRKKKKSEILPSAAIWRDPSQRQI